MKIRFYFRMMRIGFASPDGMDDFISALLSHFLAQRLPIDRFIVTGTRTP